MARKEKVTRVIDGDTFKTARPQKPRTVGECACSLKRGKGVPQ